MMPATVENPKVVGAVLGGAKPPTLMLSGLRAAAEQVVAAQLATKSPRQLRKWRLERDMAVDTFIDVLGGDRPMAELKRVDVLALRKHWQDRVVRGEVEADTGNKNIGRVGWMFRTINDDRMLGLPPIFARAGIAGGKDKQRVAFNA